MFYEVLSIQTNTLTASTVTPAILPSQLIAQHPLADSIIAPTPQPVPLTVGQKTDIVIHSKIVTQPKWSPNPKTR